MISGFLNILSFRRAAGIGGATRRWSVATGLILAVVGLSLADLAPVTVAKADEAGSFTQLAQSGGRKYCVTCYGETRDMTSKRTCYEITVATQIQMRAFGIQQCTALSGNLWYNFANGSCKGKRYCSSVIKR